MSKYKTILFDIDGTLLDFNKDQKIAFENAITSIGYNFTEEMYKRYEIINLGMWKLLEQNKITMKELLTKRFEKLFLEYQIVQDIEAFQEILSLKFQETGTLIKGSKAVLENFKDKFELAIVSNGPKEEEYKRLKNADLLKYFSNIFLSEEIGCNKPDPKFFDVVLENITNKDKSQVLIVGDSISSDILGGINSGIDTCWYNPAKAVNDTGCVSMHEIHELEELSNILYVE